MTHTALVRYCNSSVRVSVLSPSFTFSLTCHGFLACCLVRSALDGTRGGDRTPDLRSVFDFGNDGPTVHALEKLVQAFSSDELEECSDADAVLHDG